MCTECAYRRSVRERETIFFLVELAYLFNKIGQSIQAMIFDDITSHFISEVKNSNIANLHVFG